MTMAQIEDTVEEAIGGLIEEALLVRRPLTCDDMLQVLKDV